MPLERCRNTASLVWALISPAATRHPMALRNLAQTDPHDLFTMFILAPSCRESVG